MKTPEQKVERNEYQRDWNARNRDKVNERARKKYQETKWQLKYYHDNKIEILENKKVYNSSGKRWMARYNATEEQYQHYLDTTHCECCGVELTKDKTNQGKCQIGRAHV